MPGKKYPSSKAAVSGASEPWVALFSIEQLINGWKHGFEGPEDRDDTREAII